MQKLNESPHNKTGVYSYVGKTVREGFPAITT